MLLQLTQVELQKVQNTLHTVASCCSSGSRAAELPTAAHRHHSATVFLLMHDLMSGWVGIYVCRNVI